MQISYGLSVIYSRLDQKTMVTFIKMLSRSCLFSILISHFISKSYDNVVGEGVRYRAFERKYYLCRFKLNWRSQTSNKYFNGKIRKSREVLTWILHVFILCWPSGLKCLFLTLNIRFNKSGIRNKVEWVRWLEQHGSNVFVMRHNMRIQHIILSFSIINL